MNTKVKFKKQRKLNRGVRWIQVFNSELREKKNEVCLILGPALSPTYSSETSQASLGCSVLLLSCQSQSLLPGTLAFSHGTYYIQGFRFRFSYTFFKKNWTRIFFLWNVFNKFSFYILHLSKWKQWTLQNIQVEYHRAIFLRI